MSPSFTSPKLRSRRSTNYSTSFIIPVQNVVDNLSWTKHDHSLAFGTNIRFIDDRRVSNAQSFPDGQMNQGWLTRSSTIANSQGPFDPQVYGFPAVDFANYGNEYNDALMNIVGTITEGDAIYNYAKSGTALALGTPIKRDYRWNEYEFYAQDTWRVTSALTLTYGLALLLSAGSGRDQRHAGGNMPVLGKRLPAIFADKFYQGSVAQGESGGAASNVGEVAFNLNGRYNHAPDFWTPEKKDFGPRLAVAFSPAPAEGAWRRLLGNQQTSIRAGYSLVFDHFGAATVQNSTPPVRSGFRRILSNAPGSEAIEDAPRFTGIQRRAAVAASHRSRRRVSRGAGLQRQRQLRHQLGPRFRHQDALLASAGFLHHSRPAQRRLARSILGRPPGASPARAGRRGHAPQSQGGRHSLLRRRPQMAKMAAPTPRFRLVAPDPYWQQEFAGSRRPGHRARATARCRPRRMCTRCS